MSEEKANHDALDRSPEEDAAYLASLWGLSEPRRQVLVATFESHRRAAVRTTERLNLVRATIRTLPLAEDAPWFAAGELVNKLPGLAKKEVYNALTYLTRRGELEHLDYGRYLIKNLALPVAATSPSLEQRGRELWSRQQCLNVEWREYWLDKHNADGDALATPQAPHPMKAEEETGNA